MQTVDKVIAYVVLAWVAKVVGDAKMVANFLTNHCKCQALFKSSLRHGGGLEIKA